MELGELGRGFSLYYVYLLTSFNPGLNKISKVLKYYRVRSKPKYNLCTECL